MGNPGKDLTAAAEQRRVVGFDRDVQPILRGKCASGACHGGAAAGLKYEELMSKKLVDPAAARLSPLAWAIHGRVTARAWDKVAAGGAVQPMPPQGSSPLSAEERRTIVEWIDTGAHK